MSKSGAFRTESSSSRRARLETLREATLHRKVLATRLPGAFNGRWTRRQWAHASLFAPWARSSPRSSPDFPPRSALAESAHDAGAALPALPLAQLRGAAGDSWQLVTVQSGPDTGFAVRPARNSRGHAAAPAGRTGARKLRSPTSGRARARLRPAVDGQLRTLRFDRDPTPSRRICPSTATVEQHVIERPTEVRTVVISRRGRPLAVPSSARKLG